MRKEMPARMIVNRRVEGTDVNTFPHPTTEPILIDRDDFKIILPKMMVIVACML